MASPTQAEPIAVTTKIELSKPDVYPEQIGQLSTALTGGAKLIFLDLSIAGHDVDGRYDYGVTAEKPSGETVALDCADGFGRKIEPYSEVVFGFAPDYNHLILSLTMLEQPSPFNTIACEYDSTRPGEWLLTFTGYFAVSVVEIPTAYDVELRAITP